MFQIGPPVMLNDDDGGYIEEDVDDDGIAFCFQFGCKKNAEGSDWEREIKFWCEILKPPNYLFFLTFWFNYRENGHWCKKFKLLGVKNQFCLLFNGKMDGNC